MGGSVAERRAASPWFLTRRGLSGALRVLVSVTLIGYLLATANLGELLTLLRSWNATYFVVAVLLGILRNVMFAYRWRLVLSVSKIEVPLTTLVRFYFVATFFNLFLPTALGGDVVRGYDLAVHSGKKMEAAASVLMERIVGFFALAFIALVALLAGHSMVERASVTAIILVACLGYFALTAVLFDSRIMRRLVALVASVRLWNVGERIGRMVDSLHAFASHKPILWWSFLLSVVCQTLAILSAFALALAINLRLDLVYFFMMLPMIWIVTMVPLSINGLGVREGAFVFFFTRVGVSNAAALTLSFLSLSQTVILGLIGGVVHLLSQVLPTLEVRARIGGGR